MADLSSLGASTGGSWTRADALELSSPGSVRSAAARSWQVVWPGVLADAGVVLSAEQRCWAAVLASGGAHRAVAAGRTAARFWGLPLVDDADPATGRCERRLDEVVVTAHLPSLEHRRRGLLRHRWRLLPGDVHTAPSGVRVTTPRRTVRDLSVLLPHHAAVVATDAAVHRGLVGAPELQDAVLACRGRAGAAAFGAVVAAADGRAESPIESLSRLLLRPAVPSLEPQVELFDEHGFVVARVDLGDRSLRLAVECDGKAAHSGGLMVARDRARDRRTERLGWWTERVSWYDVRRLPDLTVRRVVERARLLRERHPYAR